MAPYHASDQPVGNFLRHLLSLLHGALLPAVGVVGHA
eukprot:CAMPEP_0198204446 /NCGR_PEP_ID=MMETSP1445-20131203/7861_1 /TAXON_ID=36898 /ORGANISM="Pyramimonas sp., Strain CCMP2087" /LENGTH=36 /DNA_ID= /DNA_START= /DNA_END= /DNA_ORIENTATION=